MTPLSQSQKPQIKQYNRMILEPRKALRGVFRNRTLHPQPRGLSEMLWMKYKDIGLPCPPKCVPPKTHKAECIPNIIPMSVIIPTSSSEGGTGHSGPRQQKKLCSPVLVFCLRPYNQHGCETSHAIRGTASQHEALLRVNLNG